MPLAVVGISHHTAPIGVRERFAFTQKASAAALRRLVRQGTAHEAVLLSTCNRTELYLRLDGSHDALDDTRALLLERAAASAADGARYLYTRRDQAAVEHLFRVVSSLDSMVVGEAQIQGQVKEAYEQATRLNGQGPVVGAVLARLFQTALAVGGRVRSRTTLGMGAASVPSAAIELAKKVFGTLEGRSALVLGAGEMSALALECLAAEGVRSAVVASRTAARAGALAQRVGAKAAPFEELAALLADADIVLCATSAPRPVLTRELLQRALPGGPRKALFIVDIALPRDVESAVGEVANVFRYDLDDLRQIVEANLDRRRAQLPAAERVVAEGVAEFWSWYAALDAVPLIRALRGHAEELREREVEKALRKLGHLAPDDRAAVEALTRQLLNKVLHGPTVRLREAARNGGGVAVLDVARYLFELEGPIDEDRMMRDEEGQMTPPTEEGRMTPPSDRRTTPPTEEGRMTPPSDRRTTPPTEQGRMTRPTGRAPLSGE